MRSGRGKCPQCKEIIVVDLDAAEIRCPLCGALLKKSSKTVEEVRAEEQARVAAAEARERALRGEPEEPVAETPVEVPTEAPAEEAPAEEVPVEEAPAEEPVDEIGMTDEELAALDDTLPTDEEAAPADAVDEIGMTDEELAAMDEAIPEEVAAEEAPAEEAETPAEEPVDEIGMTGEELAAMDAPVVEDAAAEEAPAEEAAVEEAPAEEEPAFEGMASPSAPADEEPAEDAVEEASVEDIPAEEPEEPAIEVAEEPEAIEQDVPAEDIPAEEAPVDEIPAEEAEIPAEEVEAPAEDIPVEKAEEAEAPIEEAAEEAPALEVEDAAVEEAPAEEQSAYTDEDMAFAASLSDGIESNKGGEKKGGYFAPVVKVSDEEKPEKKKREKKKKKAEDDADKGALSKGDNTMNGTAIYKKPIAALMFVFAILAAAIFFLYKGLLGAVSEELAETIASKLPEFSEAIVNFAFYGLILVIAALGLTGKRCKGAFVLLLILAVMNLGEAVFYGGGTPILKVKFLKSIFHDLSKLDLIYFGSYGALFIAMIIFAVSFGRGKRDLETPGSSAAIPVVYMLLVIIGYVAIVVLPILIVLEKVPENISNLFVTYIDPYIDPYAVWGIWGLSVLLTLVGVHNKALSRGVNAWMLFANLMIVVAFAGVQFVLDFLGVARAGIDTYSDIFFYISPLVLLVSFAGFAASDLRN